MRAIDADAFYKDICDSLNEMTRIGIAVDGEWLWGKLNDSLDNAPTIEPETIRCKDCKYWNDEFAKDKSTCWLPCMSMTTHREWYCGSAERRTDE